MFWNLDIFEDNDYLTRASENQVHGANCKALFRFVDLVDATTIDPDPFTERYPLLEQGVNHP